MFISVGHACVSTELAPHCDWVFGPATDRVSTVRVLEPWHSLRRGNLVLHGLEVWLRVWLGYRGMTWNFLAGGSHHGLALHFVILRLLMHR